MSSSIAPSPPAGPPQVQGQGHAIVPLTSPRRLGEGRVDPETGKKLPHATLLGHGLIDLLENHLSDLPSVNGSPFSLVVTIGVDALISGIGVATLDAASRAA